MQGASKRCVPTSGSARPYGAKPDRWRRLWGYMVFAVRFFLLRSKGPFFLGLVPNDTCNLDCVDCRVANIANSCMSLRQIRAILEDHHRKGIRFLTLSGGEPYLWRDGAYRIRDVVELARQIGYLNISIFTNGTIPMDAKPDFTWISIDGLGDTFTRIRGIELERVLRNLKHMQSRYGIVFTVNAINYLEIKGFLETIKRDLPGVKVMFFFHTPYYGIDALHLSEAQRRIAVETLAECRKNGLPVVNSRAALAAYLAGNPDLPTDFCRIIDESGEHHCCRVDGEPEMCRDCGYAVTGELAQAHRWNPGAILALANAV
jgi:MoaA/NifB/PqqE/SkfB family radical SAM enzyme